jgi:hypothetical protein
MAILQWVFKLPEPIPEAAVWTTLGFVAGVAVFAVYRCVIDARDLHTPSATKGSDDRKER